MLLRHKLNLFFIFSGLLATMLTYGLSMWVLDDFLAKRDSAQSQALTNSIKQDIEVFDRLLLLVEEKWETELSKSLPAIAQDLAELFSGDDFEEISSEIMTQLKTKYGLSDLHLINKNMMVFASTFASEVGLDMTGYGAEYENNLRSIFNNNAFFTHRVSLSTVNGNLKKYAYYSQANSNIIINGDIDLKERLLLEKNDEVADYLFGDYVDKLINKYKTINSIDVFIISPVDQWSLFHPGNRLEDDTARSLFDGTYQLVPQNNYMIEHVDLQSYRQVGFKAFLKIEFDNSLLLQTKNNLRLFFLFCAIVILAMSFYIAHFFTKKLIIDRFSRLLLQIKEKQSGEDGAIEINGNDELSSLGNEINKLMERIQIEKDTNKWLTGISEKDALTGLGNRRCLDDKLHEQWTLAKTTVGDLTLLMIDIDCFKQFNDRYGHIKGDECLQLVANTLLKVSEANNGFLARYGGEEFVCILPNADIKIATYITTQMQQSIRQLNIAHIDSDVADYVSLSIGSLSANGQHKHDSNELLKRADLLLYQSKRNGKNCTTHDELQ